MRLAGVSLLLAPLTLAGPRASAQDALLPNVSFAASEVVQLWPDAPPGESGMVGPERVLEDRPRPFDQITDVSVPTLSVFLPSTADGTGTGVLVVPGGGLERLAIEHEGYEVAEWLTRRGIAAFLLKYRVPPRDPDRRYAAGLQDAQRAMSLIRARASTWGVDPGSVGAIGFSAGAEIGVLLSVFEDERQYQPVDAADALPTRPDFNVAIYPGGLVGRDGALRGDVASRIDAGTPPMFVVHAFDDSARNSILLVDALKRVDVASELHVFAEGGHGFGLRESGLPLNRWRELCVGWLEWLGYLDTPEVRAFGAEHDAAWESGATLPRLADPGRALAAQRRIVRMALARGSKLAGFVGGADGDGAGPGVLFEEGRLEAKRDLVLELGAGRPARVALGVGFILATDVGTKLLLPRQALTAIESVVPVVALPVDIDRLVGGGASAADRTAANLGASRFVVGAAGPPSGIADLEGLQVALDREGEPLLRSGTGDLGGTGAALMALVNAIVDQGRLIRHGELVVLLLGPAPVAESGRYTARFGGLGTIELSLE